MSRKWSVKEEKNATETVFYVMNGNNVFGMVTGQNHIKGDIERARGIANRVVEEKTAYEDIKKIKPGMKIFSKVNIDGGIHMDDILKIKYVYFRGNGKPILEFEEVGGKYEFNKEKFELIE